MWRWNFNTQQGVQGILSKLWQIMCCSYHSSFTSITGQGHPSFGVAILYPGFSKSSFFCNAGGQYNGFFSVLGRVEVFLSSISTSEMHWLKNLKFKENGMELLNVSFIFGRLVFLFCMILWPKCVLDFLGISCNFRVYR